MLAAFSRIETSITGLGNELKNKFFKSLNQHKNMTKNRFIQFAKGNNELSRLALKFIRIMKLASILLIVSINLVFASYSYAQTTSLSIDMSEKSITQILDKIEEQTDFHFFYNSKLIDMERKATVKVKDKDIFSVLNQLFAGTNVRYRVIDKDIILTVNEPSLASPQQGGGKRISGTITDSNGDPIIGANIVEKGTTNGTVTNFEGVYNLDVSNNAIVTISYIGYISKEVVVANQTTINVLLSEDTQALEEVIVVGYGTMKKSDLTGSVSSVKTAEIQQTPIVSIDQGLSGRASGVQVTQTSGMPGAVASIRIRGSSSLQGGNEPLYVIDGFPIYSGGGFGNTGGNTQISGLSSINPADIESIEILKDAAATAIYGARAANGVVLITTKSGQKGRDLVTFESSFGVSNVAKKIELMDAQQYATLVNEAYTNDGLKPFYSETELAEIALLGKGTDWQDEIFRTGTTQNYQLAFAGGDEKTQYMISGNYTNTKGIVISSDFERYSVRLNLSRNISKTFSVGTHFTASHSINNAVMTDSGGEGGVVNGAIKINPIQPVYSNPETGIYTQVNTPGKLNPNPVATAKEMKFNNATSRLLGDIFLQWEIIPDLRLKVTAGADVIYHKINRYIPSTIYQANGQAKAHIGVNKTINWLNENTINWNKTINDIHALNMLGGFTLQRNIHEYVFASSGNFVNDVMEYNNLGAGSVYNAPASNNPQWSLLSYLARINYSLNQRYLLSVNARIDGSSRFGANNKYGFFPSASAGWRISEESFMESMKDILPNLKVRASYGFTGNTEIGVYESLATLGSNNWVIGNQQVSGFFPNIIPNPDLKWEKTGQIDIGVDIGLLDNRINITADYYEKKTTDLLYNVAIPGVSGYQTMLKNIGSVKNYGYEFSIESNNLTGPFKWNTAFNISFNKSKVISLGGEEYKEVMSSNELHMGSIRRLIVGQPIGIFYGYSFDGIFQNEAECAQQTASVAPIGVGLRRLKDLNGDGKVDAANDREILGDSNPDFFGGLSNTFAYKGFELNAFLQYSYGNEIFNFNAIESELPSGGQNVYRDLINRWTPENPSNIYPKATTNRNVVPNDRFVEDGSYLKLKTLSLSYGFPKLKYKHIQGVRLFVTGQNLLTWTKYRGYDPEVSYRGASTLEAGEDLGGYPQSRTYMFGIKLDIK